MDRNTILAIVLSVVVIVVGMTIQTMLFEPEMVAAEESVEIVDEANVETTLQTVSGFSAVGEIAYSGPFNVTTENFDITFDPSGGTISSIKTLKHLENGDPVELLFKDADDDNALMMYYGHGSTQPIDDIFAYTISHSQDGTMRRVVFSRDFETENGDRFTLEKTYIIPESNEYMISLQISAKDSDGNPVALSSGYTLSLGPQVGPAFQSLGSNYDYRRVEVKYSDSNKKSNARFNRSGLFTADSDRSLDWIGIAGKYFSLILVPDNVPLASSEAEQLTYEEGVSQEDIIYLNRSTSTAVNDTYYLYAGPKVESNLAIYNNADNNVFGLSNLNLEEAIDGNWLSWLEAILKWILQLFYRIIPNYGVAIILLTILIKLILQPLSKKGMESTAKMSALQPKIEEIKNKFPDDPEAQNSAMAKLYKDEKINPMGSCLPMLIQFPIFIALYGLLNTNFDLRGSMFIPGWIPDLSIPDTIYTLPFSIPFIGSSIHLLPILYVISMIFSMKITQNTSTAGQQAGMMAFMTYGMPIIFFFIMYNAPSGLLLYWSTVNIISIGQQMLVNKKKKNVYAQEIAEKDAEKQAKKDAKKKGRRK